MRARPGALNPKFGARGTDPPLWHCLLRIARQSLRGTQVNWDPAEGTWSGRCTRRQRKRQLHAT